MVTTYSGLVIVSTNADLKKGGFREFCFENLKNILKCWFSSAILNNRYSAAVAEIKGM
jgi:hypothetical protein